MRDQLGQGFVEFLGFNPLGASLEGRLKADYANSDSLVAIEKEIKTYSQVKEIDYPKALLDLVNENVRQIVERHPGSEPVVGWLIDEPDFAVHSVVRMNGTYLCVTPSLSGDDGCAFMPDHKITWTRYGDTLAPVRNGQMILGPGVRQYPAFTTAKFKIIRRRLEEGASLEDAQVTREEFEALRREHFSV